MSLDDLLKRYEAYIGEKGRFRVLLTKEKDGVTWYATVSVTPSEVLKKPGYAAYLVDLGISRWLATHICRLWDADIGDDGSRLITFRVYVPKEYTI
jgi:hypothetical protein